MMENPYPEFESVDVQVLRFAVSAVIRDAQGRVLLQ